MKEKTKQQPTTSKKSSHNTLDWVEKELKDLKAFDLGIWPNSELVLQTWDRVNSLSILKNQIKEDFD